MLHQSIQQSPESTSRRSRFKGPNTLTGGIGTVAVTVKGNLKRGRVFYKGSEWFAVCDEPLTLAPGTLVRIVDMRNTTLVVELEKTGY